MCAQFGAASPFGVVGSHYVGPQEPCGTQFGDFHEVVGADREVELNGRSHLVYIQPHVGQANHIFVSHGQGEGQFLDNRSAAVVEQRGIDSDKAYPFVLGCFFEEGFDAFELLGAVGSRAAPGAFFGEFHEGVDAEGGKDLFGVEFFGRDLVEEEFGHSGGAAAAEGQFDGRNGNAFEQGVEVCCRELFVFDDEAERIDSFHQHIVCSLVGGGHVVANFEGLAHAPHVVGLHAAHIRKCARFRVEVFKFLEVFSPVVGLHVESLEGAPHQFFGAVGSFEVFGNRLFPLPGGNRRKFGHQLVRFFFCHDGECIWVIYS